MATDETFGSIINRLAEQEGKKISLSRIAKEADISWTHFHTLVTGIRAGKPIYPTFEIVEKVMSGFEKIGLPVPASDQAALIQIAAKLPTGFEVVKEDLKAEPPENFADWPEELQEALAFVKDMTPKVQKFIFQLWREQAQAHHSIEVKRREAMRELELREAEIQAQKNRTDR